MNTQWSHAHAVIKGEASEWVKCPQQVRTPSATKVKLDKKPSETQPSVHELTYQHPKEECTGELSNAKWARRTGRPVWEIAEEAKKNPFTTVGQIQKLGGSVSTSANKRRLYQNATAMLQNQVKFVKKQTNKQKQL